MIAAGARRHIGWLLTEGMPENVPGRGVMVLFPTRSRHLLRGPVDLFFADDERPASEVAGDLRARARDGFTLGLGSFAFTGAAPHLRLGRF